MKKIYRLYEVEEEQNQQTSGETQQPSGPKPGEKVDSTLAPLEKELAQTIASYHNLLNEISTKSTEYNNRKKTIRQKIDALNKQIAAVGGHAGAVAESVDSRFSRRLFEAVRENKTEEVKNALVSAFESVDGISYTPNETKCTTFAKRIIAYMNGDEDFKDSDEKRASLREYTEKMFKNAQYKLQDKEITKVLDEFEKILENSVLFAWIYKE